MKKTKIAIVASIIIIAIAGVYFADKMTKKMNYNNVCSKLLNDMDACSANQKCQHFSYCPEFDENKTACCPKGLFKIIFEK